MIWACFCTTCVCQVSTGSTNGSSHNTTDSTPTGTNNTNDAFPTGTNNTNDSTQTGMNKTNDSTQTGTNRTTSSPSVTEPVCICYNFTNSTGNSSNSTGNSTSAPTATPTPAPTTWGQQVTFAPLNGAAASAAINLTFIVKGTYRFCYRTFGIPQKYKFQEIAGSTVKIEGSMPSLYASDGGMALGQELVTISVGSGLDLRAGGDAAKIVAGNGTCADDPDGGTLVVTDLGPTDETGDPTVATMLVSFTSGGAYKVCYKPSGAIAPSQL